VVGERSNQRRSRTGKERWSGWKWACRHE